MNRVLGLGLKLWRSVIVIAIASVPCGGLSTPAQGAPLTDFDVMGHTGPLRRNVDFWIDVYSKYHTQEGLIHDARRVDRVYEVVRAATARSAKRKWRAILLKLHSLLQSGKIEISSLNDDEKRAFALYSDDPDPDKFLNAAHRKRLRFQQGQRESFEQGLKYSGRYLPQMEEIFRKNGMPVELTRLPFVESSFNIRARSKVGATGIWQFMPSTGRLFLRVDDVVDERNDPLRATEAAAQLLKLNYESLGAWPIAVTAYNHGRKGMMRAVRRVGSTDLEDMLSTYRSRSFGFASSNFYACLVAAIHVEKNASKLFGTVERQAPPSAFELNLTEPINLPGFADILHYDPQTLRDLNPGITEEGFSGRRVLPVGYRLRLPLPSQSNPEKAAYVLRAQIEALPPVFKKPSLRRSRKTSYPGAHPSGNRPPRKRL